MANVKSRACIEEDRFLASQIADATHFTAHLRVSPHEKYTHVFLTFDEAEAEAERLTQEHSRFGRRGLVYAVTSKGYTIHCTRELWELAQRQKA